MSYENNVLQTFYHFSTEEHEKIEMWLIKHGYTWGTNTVCGSCCGMYADEYWVDVIEEEPKKAELGEVWQPSRWDVFVDNVMLLIMLVALGVLVWKIIEFVKTISV